MTPPLLALVFLSIPLRILKVLLERTQVATLLGLKMIAAVSSAEFGAMFVIDCYRGVETYLDAIMSFLGAIVARLAMVIVSDG